MLFPRLRLPIAELTEDVDWPVIGKTAFPPIGGRRRLSAAGGRAGLFRSTVEDVIPSEGHSGREESEDDKLDDPMSTIHCEVGQGNQADH